MATGLRLYFHAPCFDGVASAVLASDFFESYKHVPREAIDLRPVTYDIKKRWAEALEAPAAVVDFLFHPRADFWADHHSTTFLTANDEQTYRRERRPAHFYDPEAPSCAGLLWTRLSEEFGYQNSRYQELVTAADKIDAARYASVQETMDLDNPAIQISLSMGLDRKPEYVTFLVRALKDHLPADVVRDSAVADRVDRIAHLMKVGLARFERSARLLEDGIVVFDVDGTDAFISRYAPYYFFPDARYSLGVVRTVCGAKITAMRNPWSEFESVPLGKLFRQVGGGGHRRVASVALSTKRSEESTRLLDQLLEKIRDASVTQ